jgi:hypothetical protein
MKGSGSDRYFTRNETNYLYMEDYHPSVTTVVLDNNLLGKWKTADGTIYEFKSDAGLTIGTTQYGYLVRGTNKLLTYDPSLTGTAAVQEYTFSVSGSTLSLTPKTGTKITLTKQP